MRVWVDLTNSPHVLVFRPLIRLLRERGHEVEVTAREYAQTLQLLELHGIEATPIGRHGGRSALGKARAELGRLPALRRWAQRRRFDLALAHGSHDLTLTARSLGIPSATTFDYEFAWLQHQLGCRAATRVVVPEAIPAERLAPYGARQKLRRYPGLKEEYYLADFEPAPVRRAGAASSWSSPARRRRSRSTTGTATRSSSRCSTGSGRDERVHAVVLPRTDEQRARIRGLGLPSLHRPRPRGRRAEPDRRRRRCRLGRRDDEPRGGRARHARLHDVRGPARRGRRAADPRGAADRSCTIRPQLDLDGAAAPGRAPTTRPEPAARPPARRARLGPPRRSARASPGRRRGRRASSARLRGRRPAISSSVELWKTTYAGTSSARARSSRHAFSASKPSGGSAHGRLGRQLGEEAARLADPGDREALLRARHPDVEQPPLLVDLRRPCARASRAAPSPRAAAAGRARTRGPWRRGR